MQLDIAYPTRPLRPTVHTSLVMDHFGLDNTPPPHVVASDLHLPIRPHTVVAFTGPSGSGKSTLLRAVIDELQRNHTPLSPGRGAGGEGIPSTPVVCLSSLDSRLSSLDAPVIDALGLAFDRATALLSSCGLAEPRLMLRRPAELSDGERWRFRLALALAKGPSWIAADEFTAPLDRTLAKVIAFNVRRQCDRTRTGFLLATCHEDILQDLRPDLHVRCDLDGTIEVRRVGRAAGEAHLQGLESFGTRADCPALSLPSPWGEGPGVRGGSRRPTSRSTRKIRRVGRAAGEAHLRGLQSSDAQRVPLAPPVPNVSRRRHAMPAPSQPPSSLSPPSPWGEGPGVRGAQRPTSRSTRKHQEPTRRPLAGASDPAPSPLPCPSVCSVVPPLPPASQLSTLNSQPLPSFAPDLHLSTGSLKDWPPFARWHYRTSRVGSVRFLTLLRHNDRPVGICVFTAAPLSLAGRNRFFGRRARWTTLTLRALNRQLVTLSRVVLHPTYRGAGLAAAFVRASCELCPFPWIESLAQMGGVNPFFEKAGFTRVDVPPTPRDTRAGHSAMYGTPQRRPGRGRTKRLLTPEMHAKSRFAEPVYYVFDNRKAVSSQLPLTEPPPTSKADS